MSRVESVQLRVYEEDYKHNIILSCSKDCKLKYWNIKRYHPSLQILLIALLEYFISREVSKGSNL